MTKKLVEKSVLVLVLALLLFALPSSVMAKMVIVEGEIQGAMCTVYGQKCPTSNVDAHIALEPDFILLTAGGKYYFMPNLDMGIKAKWLGKGVRVMGESDGQTILVDRVESKTGYKIWDLDDQITHWNQERSR